jgi:hypothetical protein
MVAVAGQIAHPIGQANPYRIGNDGVPRVLPGTGGIVLNHRIGDRCVGLAGDHIEPGVALHNNSREVVGPRDGPNNALRASSAGRAPAAWAASPASMAASTMCWSILRRRCCGACTSVTASRSTATGSACRCPITRPSPS